MPLDLQQPAPVDLGELGEAAQRRQLAQLQEALAKGGASRLEHYIITLYVVCLWRFAEPHPPHRSLRQKPCRLAAFAAACHQRWQTATTPLPAFPP